MSEAFPWSYIPTRSGLRHSRGRNPHACDLIVVHCTQGSTARGAAYWFQNSGAGGSAHVCIDDEEGIRCAHDNEGTYHAKYHNGSSFGIEIAGFAQWSRDEWMQHERRIIEAARIAGAWCRKYDMNPGLARLSGGRRRNGITFHKDCPGNDHWDPGPNFPYEWFMDLVHAFATGNDPEAEAEWPPPKDKTLRLILQDPKGGDDHDAYAGWDQCLGPMRWIAKHGLKSDRVAAIAWSGGIWREPQAITHVCKNLTGRVDRYSRTGDWK